MEEIIYPFLIANILFFVYETDFFIQYVKLFGLGKLFGVDKYEKHLETFSDNTYWEWIAFEKQTFLRKLLSCPICSGFWVNIAIACFLHKDVGLFLINLWLSLFLYFILKLLMKKCYE